MWTINVKIKLLDSWDIDFSLTDKADVDDDEVPFDISDLAGEGNIENMLLVEKGMRELASLKVVVYFFCLLFTFMKEQNNLFCNFDLTNSLNLDS